MCVRFTGRWRVAKEDRIAYKVVAQDVDGLLTSQVKVSHRASQGGRAGFYQGQTAYYELGVKMIDEDGFGFYLHIVDPSLFVGDRDAVLKVRIPKGSQYRLAYDNKMNAREIIPFEIVKDIKLGEHCHCD